MTQTSHLIAVDVGNTAVKLATIRQSDSVTRKREDEPAGIGPDHGGAELLEHCVLHHTDRWEQAVVDWAVGLFGTDRVVWRLASVRQSAADPLIGAIQDAASHAKIELVTRHQIPLTLDVEHPDRVGIDRLLSAYAAVQQAAVQQAATPTVVINAGTAITVDWIDQQNVYRGGAILPGIRLQSRSLSSDAESLPTLKWSELEALTVPATNTADAMKAGILIGACAAIDELIRRYQRAPKSGGGKPQVVVSGGDATTISPHLKHSHQLCPNLVCRGLLDLPRSGGQPNEYGNAES